MYSHHEHYTNGSVKSFDVQMKCVVSSSETRDKKICVLSFSSRILEVLRVD